MVRRIELTERPVFERHDHAGRLEALRAREAFGVAQQLPALLVPGHVSHAVADLDDRRLLAQLRQQRPRTVRLLGVERVELRRHASSSVTRLPYIGARSRVDAKQLRPTAESLFGRAGTPRVAVIGAGFGGIAAGVKLKRAGIDTFTIYESSLGIGGTWWDNTYPGAEVDVGSHLYSLLVQVARLDPNARRSARAPAIPRGDRRRVRAAPRICAWA